VLVIFGIRVLYRVVGRGLLHCQRCGGDRPYRHRAGRHWLTLFFIPVIPLTKAGEHVQCTECGTCYRMGVLDLPTVAQMQAALPAGMTAAATTMLRAGDPGSSLARRRAISAIREAGLEGYDDDALTADLALAAEGIEDEQAPLASLAVQLALPAAEWFLADVVRIGLADGPLTAAERRAAAEVAARLGMTPAHARGVISMTEESATA